MIETILIIAIIIGIVILLPILIIILSWLPFIISCLLLDIELRIRKWRRK